MKTHETASFSLIKFKVPIFSYNESTIEKPKLDLFFDTKGEYNSETGIYNLFLDFKGIENTNKTEIINSISIASFKFSDKIELNQIPDYFYANSIAIMFPYVRSFISTLTLQTNTGLILLDTLNLTNLKSMLKENTINKIY